MWVLSGSISQISLIPFRFDFAPSAGSLCVVDKHVLTGLDLQQTSSHVALSSKGKRHSIYFLWHSVSFQFV